MRLSYAVMYSGSQLGDSRVSHTQTKKNCTAYHDPGMNINLYWICCVRVTLMMRIGT